MAISNLLSALRDPPSLLRELAAVPGLRLVGGWLRRAWYGEASADYDLIAVAPLDDTLARLCELTGAQAFALNERFATRRLVLDGATLDVSALHPDGLEADVARRDYTVNTLSIALDALGPGLSADDIAGDPHAFADLDARMLRMVSAGSLAADPLRLLRGYRLAATEALTPEPQTRATWAQLAELLDGVAGERIHEELLRWFAAPGIVESLQWCADDGVLWPIFPPLRELVGCGQRDADVQGDVWTHTLTCLRQLDVLLAELPAPLQPWAERLAADWQASVSGMASRGTLTRLALLLHDVAKPATRELQPEGHATFYGHQDVGAEMLEPLLGRLKFSQAECGFVLRLVREHLRLGFYSEHEPLPPKLAYRFIRRLGEAAPLMLLHSIADCAATGGRWAEDAYTAHLRTSAELLRHYYDADNVARPPLLLDGMAIMQLLSIPPGPLIGQLKEALLEATAAGEVESVADAEQFVSDEYERIRNAGSLPASS